jgi:hypothetical protein
MIRMRACKPSMARPLQAAILFASIVTLFTRPSQAQDGELIVLKETGPRDKRVNMVILGDGYTAAEKDKFKTHMQSVSDAITKDYPLWDYSDYFNIYGIFVASNQSGADQAAKGIYKDTYFGAAYDPNLDSLLTIDDAKAFKVINKFVPESDLQFAIVNSDVYGGSGGQIAVAAYMAPEIIAHETQHSFTGLGDEYDYAGSVLPWEAPNTTAVTARNSIRWSHWILPATAVPTPETQVNIKLIGLFEGAAYNTTGWYRPKQNCRMKENDAPFCEVCMEAIILSMYQKVSPLDSAFPLSANVSVSAGNVPPLRVRTKHPLFHAMEVDWFVDGALQADVHGESFTKSLTAGGHRVTAKISDTTAMVRKDAKGLLKDSTFWNVSVSSVAGIDADRDAIGKNGPNLVRADGREFWARLPAQGAFRIRLSAADGSLAEERTISNGAGLNRVAWDHALAPGIYAAEIVWGGRSARKRFSVQR